jgi:hypothetical protein
MVNCFQDTFYNKILTSRFFGKPLEDPPPPTLPCVQYIDPEVPSAVTPFCQTKTQRFSLEIHTLTLAYIPAAIKCNYKA